MWCKVGGRTVNGLLRRKEEAQMFLRSSFSSSTTTGGDYDTVTVTVLNVRSQPTTNSSIIKQWSKRTYI